MRSILHHGLTFDNGYSLCGKNTSSETFEHVFQYGNKNKNDGTKSTIFVKLLILRMFVQRFNERYFYFFDHNHPFVVKQESL